MTAQTRMVVSIITAGMVGSDDAATRWILASLSKHPRVRAESLALCDFPLRRWGSQPKPIPESVEDEMVARWIASIARSDGFIFHIAPEHDGSVPATLMNAFDWGYPAWKDKAAAFVSGRGHRSWRVIWQLRGKATALRMIAARSELRMPVATQSARREVDEAIDELIWWTQMLKAMREERDRAATRNQQLMEARP